MNRLAVLTALMLVSIIAPTGIYALQNQMTPEIGPNEAAIKFIRYSPTFGFDGIDTSLRVIDSVEMKSNPTQYLITLTFTCLHSGYGYRAGKPVLQVLTPHTAIVTVAEGKIINAVLDNGWDELNQVLLQQASELVIKTALDWLRSSPTFKFDGLEESLKVLEVWQAQTFAYPSFWQVTIEFDSLHPGYGDRTGQVLAQVVTHHTVRIHVTEGEVTMAIIDEKWDELKQIMIPTTHTKEEAEQVALEWLYECPTFKFDGIKDTVKVQRIDTLRMPNTYEVYIGFICNYPGYGDRTGHVTLGHSQQHVIRITVQEGLVTRAIIDGVWDEINQKLLNKDKDLITSQESARDYLVGYLIKTYNLGFAKPVSWIEEDLTPKGTIGSFSTRYVSDPWSATVNYPVILEPTYSISINYNGSSPFTWEGTLLIDGVVTTNNTNIEWSAYQQRIFGPIEARGICIEYILLNHPEIKDKPPATWDVKNLIPEGIVGATKLSYTGDDWEVIISGPVVWKPTYNVEVIHIGPGSFEWSGILAQGGQVQELAFKN